MSILNDPLMLREVLKYDSYVGSDLTAYERMVVHQKTVQDISISKPLAEKLERIAKTINQTQWEAPEVRYNSARLLEIYNPDTEQWEPFKDPKERK